MAWFKSKQERTEESLLEETRKSNDYLRDMSENSAVAGVGTAVGGGIRHGARKSVFALRSHNLVLFLVLVFVLNFYHVWRNSFAFPGDIFVMSLYIFVAFLAAFVFYNDTSDPFPIAHFGRFMLITAAAYFVPFIIKYAKDAGLIHVPLATFLMILAPVWVIFIFINNGGNETVRKLALLFFIGWLIYLCANGLLQLGSQTQTQVILLSPGEARDALAIIISKVRGLASGAVDVATSPIDTSRRVYNDTKNFFNGQLAGATQEYYTGTVDQSQGVPIGVFITNAEPIYTKFRSDTDDVIVTATLTARTFSDQLTVQNTCSLEIFDTTDLAKAGNVHVPGTVVPQSITILYTGEFQEKHAIDCTVKQSDYSKHLNMARATTGTLYLNSTFDFETWGYAEYGFMDRQLIQAFRTENQNPAEVLGIDPTLRPKYTPGPLMVGMPADTQPVSFDSEAADPHLPAFGVTFSNAWMGKGVVREFKAVEFLIPKPFIIEDFASCTPKEGTAVISDGKRLDFVGPSQWTEVEAGQEVVVNEAYNKYTVQNVAIRDGESFITIRCPLEIDAKQAESFPALGSSGAGKFTFFVHADYVYSTWTRTPVNLQGVAS